MPIWLLIVAAIVLFGFFMLGVHNGLDRAAKQVEEAWPVVEDVLAKRRAVVEQLVATVHAHAPQEPANALLNESRVVAVASSQANARQSASAENNLTRALRGLFVVTPRYPQLNADPSFRQLLSQLAQLEMQTAGPRAAYNEKVERYNKRLASGLAKPFVSAKSLRPGEQLESAAG